MERISNAIHIIPTESGDSGAPQSSAAAASTAKASNEMTLNTFLFAGRCLKEIGLFVIRK